MYCDTHNLTQVSLKPGSSYLMCVCSSADALMFYIHGIFEQHQTSCCTVKNQWAPPLETPLLEQSCSLTQALKSRCFMYSFFSFLWKKLARSHKMYSQSLMDLRKRQDHWPSWGKVNFTTTVRHTAFEMILSDLQPPHLLVISTSFRCMLQYSLLTSLSSRWVRTLFITSLAHLRSTPSHQPPHLVHGANLQLLSPTHLLYSNSRCWVCKTKETKIWHRDNSHLLSFLFFFFWFQCLLDPCLVGWGMYKKPGAGVVMLVQHLFSIL